MCVRGRGVGVGGYNVIQDVLDMQCLCIIINNS